MNAPPRLFTLPEPVAPHWRHAWGGVWRLTLHRHFLPGRWLMVLIGLAVLALLGFAPGRGGLSRHFTEWTVAFYATFLVPALAFISAAGAMRDEMKSSTVDYVFTRPVRRPAFVAFRFLAHTVCAQLDFLLALGVVLVVGAARGVPGVLAIMPALLLGQVLLVTAFSALGFLAGVLTSRYIILGFGYAGVIEVGIGQIPTQLSRLSMTQQVRTLVDTLLLRSEAHSPGLLAVTGTLVLFTLVVLALAALLFHHREQGAASET
ncbi:MAG: ABC transporter permease [Opitutaceae bacterium]|nr:ABC transporter permease [Opitutaceae bacterium]